METPDYYEYCLLRATRELKVQVAALVEQCGENSESNEAEATWLAAAVIEALTVHLNEFPRDALVVLPALPLPKKIMHHPAKNDPGQKGAVGPCKNNPE